MTSIPPSSDLPNMHDHLGTKQDAQFLLTDATKQAIAQTGYHVEGSKGRGGFGATYEVKHQESGARAIAKVMLDPKDEHHLKAFQRECRVLASEHVPSDLVPGYITHVQRDGIQPFVLMESIDGTEIHKYVSQPHRLELDRRIEIVEKLFRAYQRLHDCNIVHGDPSPRNTLVQSGDRIRFIDFGSACRLSQGYGTLGTVSLKGITPGYGDDDILINGKRPDRWTDLYAAAAIAFQVLTDQAPPADPSTWDRVLIEMQVPQGVRSVILKARRKRDERAEIDPLVFKTVGGAADALHDWRAHRDAMVRDEEFRLRRRQQRRNHFLASAVLLLIVGAIGAVGWWKYDHERQLGDSRAFDDLRRQVEPLANANHPGVARFISEATGEGVPVKRAIALLTQARAASRDIEWAESMRQSLGDVLNESPWLVSAKAIQERKDALAKRFLTLKADLEAGQTDDLQPRFAELHRDLAQLAHDNTEAAPAEQRQIEFNRLANSVASELQVREGYVEITQSAEKGAMPLLEKGQWHDAGLQFGSCTQRLIEWLKVNETDDQRKARQKADSELLAAVEREKEQLKAEVASTKQTVTDKNNEIVLLKDQFTKLTQERLDDRQKVETTTAALASEQKQRKEVEAKLGSLETANQQLTAEAKGLAELKATQGATVKELTATKEDVTTLMATLKRAIEIDDLRKEAIQVLAKAASTREQPVYDAVLAQFLEIDKKLGAYGPGKPLTLLTRDLTAAGEQVKELEALRQKDAELITELKKANSAMVEAVQAITTDKKVWDVLPESTRMVVDAKIKEHNDIDTRIGVLTESWANANNGYVDQQATPVNVAEQLRQKNKQLIAEMVLANRAIEGTFNAVYTDENAWGLLPESTKTLAAAKHKEHEEAIDRIAALNAQNRPLSTDTPVTTSMPPNSSDDQKPADRPAAEDQELQNLRERAKRELQSLEGKRSNRK